jgi:hypothetical protein
MAQPLVWHSIRSEESGPVEKGHGIDVRGRAVGIALAEESGATARP